MKVISKRLASYWRGELVKREFELWKELNNSPFIVKMHYVFNTETTFNFVMEFCPGGTLLDYFKIKRILEPKIALIYFIEILLILEHMHSHNMIYRDLKAENILLDEFGHIKLTDFGLARRMEDSGRNENLSFCGSPIYIAPETLLKQDYSRKVDFYALGVLLYEMVVGVPPFYNKSSAEIKRLKVEQEAVFPANLDKNLIFILEKCISKVKWNNSRIQHKE